MNAKTAKTAINTESITIELPIVSTHRCTVNLGWDAQLVADPKTAAALVELLARCTMVTSSYVGGSLVLTPSTRKPTIELGEYAVHDRDATQKAIELVDKLRRERKESEAANT